MKLQKLPILIIISLSTLLFLHIEGVSRYWYIYFPFLDIINHLLGGFSIALIVFWLSKNPKLIIPISMIAGIGWEVFEVYYDITGWPISTLAYKFDTIKDLLMDFTGAFIVFLIIKYKK